MLLVIKLKPNVNEMGSSQIEFFHESKNESKHKLLYNECSNCFYCGIAIACWYWREMTAYHIVGNFANWWKSRSFTACSVPKDASLSNFAEKTFANSHKTSKSQKFLPSKVSCYTLPSCVTEREVTL